MCETSEVEKYHASKLVVSRPWYSDRDGHHVPSLSFNVSSSERTSFADGSESTHQTRSCRGTALLCIGVDSSDQSHRCLDYIISSLSALYANHYSLVAYPSYSDMPSHSIEITTLSSYCFK